MANTEDRRKKNRDFYVTDEVGDYHDRVRGGCLLAVMMDIRDELQALNRVFGCYSFQSIPRKLDRISANTHKPRRRRVKKT